MRKVIIGDLDGAISDDRWRRRFILPESHEGRADAAWPNRFARYHELSAKDAPRNLHLLLKGVDYVFLTGRPVRYALITANWLIKVAGISPLHVIHRNNDDHRRSVDVKRDQVRWLLDPNGYDVKREEIISAFDDMEEIVKMYREEYGFIANVLRIGEEESLHG